MPNDTGTDFKLNSHDNDTPHSSAVASWVCCILKDIKAGAESSISEQLQPVNGSHMRQQFA